LPIPWPLILCPRPKCAFSEAGLQWYWCWGRGVPSERGWEGVLSCLPWWGGRERGTGSSQNTCHLPWVTRYLLLMLPLHDQGRGAWILLHVVSGPWTSFVAALDKGQCRKAVCRRHKYSAIFCPLLYGHLYSMYFLIVIAIFLSKLCQPAISKYVEIDQQLFIALPRK